MPRPRRRSLVRATLAAVVVTVGAGFGAGAASGQNAVVVELFTSQGCSSCPPADRNLARLVKRPDVLALSFHVDYWDYIGWKDPFASPATTARQHGYAQALKQRYVYTPEMVFDGQAHDPGTSVAKLEKLIAAAAARPHVRLNPVLALAPADAVRVTLPDMPRGERSHDIWVVTYDARRVTPVARGENGGATLENHNVVRSVERYTTWAGGSGVGFVVPADRIAAGRSVAVLVQLPDLGAILGAAKIDRTPTN